MNSDASNKKALAVVSLILTSICLLWYVLQIFQFGFGPDLTDLLGGYFFLNLYALLALMTRFREASTDDPNEGIQFVACALAIPLTAVFLGQLLSTFDPFYGVNQMVFAYLLRSLFLGVTATTLAAMTPGRFFRFPKWLLGVVFLITAAWIFVYACPSIIREWYGTRTEPSALFPEGLLIFEHANPEGDIQWQLFTGAITSWVALVVIGRILMKKQPSAQQNDPEVREKEQN